MFWFLFTLTGFERFSGARQLWTCLTPAEQHVIFILKLQQEKKKTHQSWSYEVFTGWQKTTVALSFLEEKSANVPWSGWDEEITKQTGGFTRN